MTQAESKTRHTPGAMRAAQAISQMSRFPVNKLDIAEIIDRETVALEMLEALESIASKLPIAINHAHVFTPEDWHQLWKLAEATIRKAKGEL